LKSKQELELGKGDSEQRKEREARQEGGGAGHFSNTGWLTAILSTSHKGKSVPTKMTSVAGSSQS
jgi:hypothetical protein